MPRRPRWGEILPKLEAFLGEVLAGHADLPATDDGKVNVLQLVRRLGLKDDDRQYFYKWAELHKPLNSTAVQVGLAPIRPRGSDGGSVPDDQVGAAFMSDRAESAARREAEAENVELRAQVRRLTLERDAAVQERDQLRQRLALIQETGLAFRVEPVHDL